MTKTIFTPQERIFVLDNYKNKTTYELVDILNEKFNKSFTFNQVRNYKKMHHLKSGVIPQYQKNTTPHNKKNIGDEYVNTRTGITFIKIGEPNKWVPKHRYIYQKNKGEIPQDCKVIFADGNNKNFDINNLICVSRNELSTLVGYKILFDTPQLTKIGLLIAKLKVKANRKDKKNEN